MKMTDYARLAETIVMHPSYEKLALRSNIHDLATRADSALHNGERRVAQNDIRHIASILGIEVA